MLFEDEMTYLHFAQAMFVVVNHLLQRFEISYGSHVAKNELAVQRDEYVKVGGMKMMGIVVYSE